MGKNCQPVISLRFPAAVILFSGSPKMLLRPIFRVS